MARMNAENMYYANNQSVAVNWRWRKDGDITYAACFAPLWLQLAGK
jgi:hypothetical protein